MVFCSNTSQKAKKLNMKVAVMASGRGSNFQSIIDSSEKGDLPNAEITHLIVDKKEARAINKAKKHNIDCTLIESKGKKREEFEKEILDVLRTHDIEIIVLAGFMRILTPEFIKHYKNRIINIHPSLLPSFPGANAHRDTINARAKISGCTVHLVDDGVDTGPIIMQASVELSENETEESLSEKILPLEHKLFPKAIELLCSNKIQINGKNVTIKPD